MNQREYREEGPVSGPYDESGHDKKNARLLFSIIAHSPLASRCIHWQLP